MNTQHTPGLLRVGNYSEFTGGLEILGPEGSGVIVARASTISRDSETPSAQVHNAERIVACWNALVDLPQAALNGGWTRAGLEAYGLRMKRQRDELLDALREARFTIEEVIDKDKLSVTAIRGSTTIGNTLVEIKSAIRKVEQAPA